MTHGQIKKKILSYKWEPWLERPFGAFFISFFSPSLTREVMRKTGVNAEYPVFLFERGMWHRSKQAEIPFLNDLSRYLKSGGSTRDIVKSCQKFYQSKKRRIQKLLLEKTDVLDKLLEIANILALSTSYIWLAHGLEDIYVEILKKEAPKYVQGDIEKFIGDISFPSRKNAHTLMEEALAKGVDLKIARKKFGWIKSRDGFSEGFSLAELSQLRRALAKTKKRRRISRPFIPASLRKIVRGTRELVYFRTLRTDVLYELLFLARPIFQEVAKRYGLSFEDLKNYTIQDLIKGRLIKYPSNISCACYKGNLAIFKKPILPKKKGLFGEVRGVIAFAGRAKGVVKIIKRTEDLDKVKKGDILVTQMTFPSFIMAMKKAVAFVTDEGGITCHAAIVAREMEKPCIIGAKIATKALKDGDWVEVDANHGVVTVTKRA